LGGFEKWRETYNMKFEIRVASCEEHRPKAGPLPPKSIKDEIERCGKTIVGLSRRVCQLDEELAKKDFENMELQKAVQSWKDNATFWHKETKSNKFRQTPTPGLNYNQVKQMLLTDLRVAGVKK
jgi:hypothetical protein